MGKNGNKTNEHILEQMNKKSSIELKSKISPFFTLNLISTNEHILVQMNKKCSIELIFKFFIITF